MTKKSNRWERSIADLSPNTKRNYRQAVQLFEQFHGMTMDELIDEALDEQDKRVAEHKLKIYDRILDFRSDLLDQGRYATGVATYITKLKTLYKKNRVKVPYIPPVNEIGAKRAEVIRFEDYLTKSELRKGIEYLSLIMQGRMLAMVTGGLSNEECANLKTKKHFIDALYPYHKCDDDIEALKWLSESDNVLWVICIKRGKTGKPFYAIMNPECVRVTAMAKLEEVKPLRYGRQPRNLDERLYPTEKNYFGVCCHRINDGLGFGYTGQEEARVTLDAHGSVVIPKLHQKNFRPSLVSEDTLIPLTKEAFKLEKYGDEFKVTFYGYENREIVYKYGGKSRFRAHMFRKFHATAVRGNYHIGDDGLSPLEIDELQGRGMTSVQETYIKSNPKKQKLLYCQVINNVSLWHKYRYSVRDDDIVLEVVDNTEENKKLKKENERLKQRLEISQDVREDIKELLSDRDIDEVADIVSQLLKAEL